MWALMIGPCVVLAIALAVLVYDIARLSRYTRRHGKRATWNVISKR